MTGPDRFISRSLPARASDRGTVADIIVVGNGAIGMSIAIECARRAPDARVVVIGPARRPGAASMAAGIMLNAFAELDADALDHEAGRRKFELARAASDAWQPWIATLQSIVGVRGRETEPMLRQGTIVLAATHFDDTNLDTIIETLSRFDEPHEDVDPLEVTGYDPTSRFRAHRAVYVPGEGSIEGRAVIALLDDAAEALGIVRLDDHVTSIDEHRIDCASMTLTASRIVLANGAWAQALIDGIPTLSDRVPAMFFGAGVGLQCALDPRDLHPPLPDVVLRTPNRGLASSAHCVPYDAHRCYVGASNELVRRPLASPSPDALAVVTRTAIEEYSGGLAAAHRTPVLGHRPTTIDTFPLLGATSVPGLWIATGTRRDGFHCSPIIARDIVSDMMGDSSQLDPMFAPERRPIITMDRSTGIDRAVQAYLDAGGVRMYDEPQVRTSTNAVRDAVTAMYDCANLEVGVPPEMLTLYADGHVRRLPMTRATPPARV